MPPRFVEKIDIVSPKTNADERRRLVRFCAAESLPSLFGGPNEQWPLPQAREMRRPSPRPIMLSEGSGQLCERCEGVPGVRIGARDGVRLLRRDCDRPRDAVRRVAPSLAPASTFHCMADRRLLMACACGGLILLFAFFRSSPAATQPTINKKLVTATTPLR